MKDKWLILLQKSYDSVLTATESIELEEALKDSAELSAEKARLDHLRVLLANQNLTFVPYFAARVMSKINNMKVEMEFSQGMMFAFKRVAIPMLAAAAVLVAISIFQNGSIAFDSFMGLDSLKPQYLSEFLLFNY